MERGSEDQVVLLRLPAAVTNSMAKVTWGGRGSFQLTGPHHLAPGAEAEAMEGCGC